MSDSYTNNDNDRFINKLSKGAAAEYLNNSLTEESRLKREALEIGIMGKLFGKGEAGNKNIAFLLCVLVLLGHVILIYTVFIDKNIEDATKIMISTSLTAPLNLITAFIGYLFGKGKEK